VADELEILRVTVQPAESVPQEDADRGVEPRMHVKIEVVNNTDTTLHVWASRRAFDYDASSQKLVVYLADSSRPEPTNPALEPISHHPRTPRQIPVAARHEETITIPVPTVLRRLEPGSGLGMNLVEEPIGPVREVECYVAYADIPYQPQLQLEPHKTAAELREWGKVAVATLPVPASKEA
jgi:hypothetical protein